MVSLARPGFEYGNHGKEVLSKADKVLALDLIFGSDKLQDADVSRSVS